MATVYYKVHGGKVSFAEYWRMSPNLFVFGIVGVAKLFGGMSFNFSIPRVEELHPLEWDDLPKDARQAMKGPLKLLEKAGLRTVFYHEMPVLEKERVGVGANLLAPDGKVFATVNYVRDPNQSQCETTCVSVFDDDTFGVTTTAKLQLKPNPEHITQRYPGATGEEIYEKHLEHLEEWKAEKGVQRVTPQSLPKVILRGEQSHIDFNVERGVYVPMTKAEIRAIREQQRGDEDEDDE